MTDPSNAVTRRRSHLCRDSNVKRKEDEHVIAAFVAVVRERYWTDRVLGAAGGVVSTGTIVPGACLYR